MGPTPDGALRLSAVLVVFVLVFAARFAVIWFEVSIDRKSGAVRSMARRTLARLGGSLALPSWRPARRAEKTTNAH
jgi:hypothetical protein